MKLQMLSALSLIMVSACAPTNSGIEGLWLGTLQPDDGTAVEIKYTREDQQDERASASEIAASEDQVSIEFDNGASFAGSFADRDPQIDGFYIQPANSVGGQRLAHATRLVVTPENGWTGMATPLDRAFNVFMHVEKRAEEQLIATLLNPERNITGPSRMYNVTKSAPNRYSLAVPGDDMEFSSVELNAPDKSLTMGFGPIEKLALQSIDPASDLAKNFFGEGEERQLKAPSTDGAWPVGSLDEAGFDRDAIRNLINSIANESGAEEQPQLVHSLLVARGGKLVVEEYFRNETSDKPHDIRSAGKTFASVLVGALMHEGHDLDADTPISALSRYPTKLTRNLSPSLTFYPTRAASIVTMATARLPAMKTSCGSKKTWRTCGNIRLHSILPQPPGRDMPTARAA